MSSITDFNRIDDCNKISPDCIDAYFDYKIDSDNPEKLCIHTSWGGECLDLTPSIKATETLTTLYLSPETDPNCLVYEPERGDNICINGDDLSHIISMSKLKDVDQTIAPTDGDVYIYDNGVWKTLNLQDFIYNVNTNLNSLNAQFSNFRTRLAAVETLLTPPEDAPSNTSVVFGNINLYSDSNAVIDSNGVVVSLDKTNGLYSHLLSTERNQDEIFG